MKTKFSISEKWNIVKKKKPWCQVCQLIHPNPFSGQLSRSKVPESGSHSTVVKTAEPTVVQRTLVDILYKGTGRGRPVPIPSQQRTVERKEKVQKQRG